MDVEGGDEKMEEDDEEEEKEEEELMEFKSPDQIGEELITLSLLPNSRWQSLTHLDLIKVSMGKEL